MLLTKPLDYIRSADQGGTEGANSEWHAGLVGGWVRLTLAEALTKQWGLV